MIENCKKKHQIIDDLGRFIFDYWFVNFEFTSNGKPYKSSGGQSVWSAEMQTYIPNGWKIVSLADCIQTINTGLNPRKNFVLNTGDNKYLTVKNLTDCGLIDFSNCDTISSEAMNLIHKRSDIAKDDILFASIEPLGRAYIILEKPFDWDINESVFSIRANKAMMSPYFLYFYLRSKNIVKKMEQSATGSVFKGIRISVINDMKIALPDKKVLDDFDDLIKPLIYRQKQLEKQLIALVKIKNNLLPLLMNGQVHAD